MKGVKVVNLNQKINDQTLLLTNLKKSDRHSNHLSITYPTNSPALATHYISESVTPIKIKIFNFTSKKNSPLSIQTTGE